MRTSSLDLGLALAAAARGYKVKKKSDPYFTMKLHYGAMKVFDEAIENSKGILFKDTNITYFGTSDYYILSDDTNWINIEPEV